MSFCAKGKADLIRRVTAHAKTHGRNISRGHDRRYFARNSGLHLDYINQIESSTRYVKRDFNRYAHVPGYDTYPSKCDIVYRTGYVERLRADGWSAVVNRNSVHIFGDLAKMDRDLTMLMLSDDLVDA